MRLLHQLKCLSGNANLVALLGRVAAATVAVCMAHAQPLANQEQQQIPNGFHIYNLSIASGYSDLKGSAGVSLPVGSGFFGGWSEWASGQVGYTRYNPLTSFGLTYSGEFTEQVRYSDHWYDQRANLFYSHQLNTKTRVQFSAGASEATVENVMFFTTPNPVATTTDSGTGLYSPTLASSAQTLLFGTRLLQLEASSTLTYSPSTRSHLHATVAGFQVQSRPNSEVPIDETISRARSLEGSATYGYDVTPRFEMGVQGALLETWGVEGQYRASNGGAFISKVLTPHWAVSVSGGAATISPIGHSIQPSTVTYTGGGKLSYAMRENSFIFGYTRAAGDEYGFGSVATQDYSLYWNWRDRGRVWTTQVGGDRQQLEGGLSRGTNIWSANVAISRALTRRVALSLMGSYLRESALPGVLSTPPQAFAARVMFSWTPRLRDLPTFAPAGTSVP